MAAVARETASPPKGQRAREASRKVVSAIGRAPRAIVCWRHAHDHEIILGRIDSDQPCARCGKALKQGVVVQTAAKRRTG